MSTTETLSKSKTARHDRTSTSQHALGIGATKIQDEHLQKLAIVYVRQSSPHQVVHNRESRERQYELADLARTLGWSSDSVIVIDEDQATSATRSRMRSGFERVLAEVSMDHVGIVFALELSRLARLSKDWPHLFEVCGIFGTLLADQDGVYDASDPNDRLVLGLKGIMSEMEIHNMRNRLTGGKLHKAERGELFLHVSVGYVKVGDDKIALEPDEQARSVVHLVFDKFEELGSGHAVFRYLRRHDIHMGIRPIDGPDRGKLIWRPPSIALIYSMLKHPAYGGMYSYGRHPVDHKRDATHKVPRRWVEMDEWKVAQHDKVPAYITWDQYLRNRARLKHNRSLKESKGAPRQGLALLGGLVYCARCGRRLNVGYDRKVHPRYDCVGYLQKTLEKTCCGVRASCIDDLVTQQVLRALEPAGIELSVQAADNIQRERDRLTTHWKQRLERAQYEVVQAKRRYRAVDPENRLVARTLEAEWETALRQERRCQDEFDRFQRETPSRLTASERELIREISSDIPKLWHALGTTAADRKEIIRHLIERVVIDVRGNTEHVDVTIHWAGGYVSQHSVVRPVLRYTQLEYYDRIMERIVECRKAGETAAQIAIKLNEEGFQTPSARSSKFNKNIVNQLLSRTGMRRPLLKRDQLKPDEWWLADLAEELKATTSRLHHWIRKGYIHSRKNASSKFWILWADEDELKRLRQLRDYLKIEKRIPYPPELTTPKQRTIGNGKRDQHEKT